MSPSPINPTVFSKAFSLLNVQCINYTDLARLVAREEEENQMTAPPPAIAVAHVGLTVPDLGAAMDWYMKALGLQELDIRLEFHATDSPELENAFATLYDGRCTGIRMGFLLAGGATVIEVFEFEGVEYRRPEEPLAFDRGGIWHFGFQVVDIEAALDWIEALGGERQSEVLVAFPDRPYRYAYFTDPWGNLVELQTHGLIQMFANQG